MRLRRSLFSCLLSVAACRTSTEPFAGLDVKVALSSATASANAPVAITTTVTNRGLWPVTIETNPCPARFRVVAGDGHPVELATQVCDLVSMPRELEPGDQFSFHDQWDGRDGTGVLTAGQYQVIGQPFSSAGPQSAPAQLTVQN